MKRSLQNQALKDLQELVATFQDFEEDVRHVLLRNHFEEARRPIPWKPNDPMKGTPPPHPGDPTGEEAVAESETDEDIAKTISKMAKDLGEWLATAKWIRGLAGTDVVARAQRTIPDCLACGDPIPGRIRSGFDDKCYKRWTRSHRPDRVKFIALVKAEKINALEELGDDV